jgi:hypothetical protein
MNPSIHPCQCPQCCQAQASPVREQHQQMNLFVSRLDEQQRRWYAALESKRMGHGGDSLLSQITGLDVETIRRGRREWDGEWADRPSDRVRLPGGGQPPVEKKSRRWSRP